MGGPLALAVVAMALPATGFVVPPHRAGVLLGRAGFKACAVTTSMSSAHSMETRRKILQKIPLTLLAIPLLHPDASAAATTAKTVWGIDVPLKPDVQENLQDHGRGVRSLEVYPGRGISPSKGDMVRVQLSAFSMDGRPMGTYSGVEKLFELGKSDMAAGIEAQVQAMRIGAQRVIILEPEAGFRTAAKRFRENLPQDDPLVVFVHLIGIKGRPCSSSMEERAKGNMVDFHICGEVNERTEKVRLFCEQSASGVCVEGDYLELQARNAAKGRAPPMFPVGKY